MAAFERLRRPGLLDGASGYVRTPRSGGIHVYVAGSRQHNGHLAGEHADFRSAGGYILATPSWVDNRDQRCSSAPHSRGAPEMRHMTQL
jgi:hypothetical protein